MNQTKRRLHRLKNACFNNDVAVVTVRLTRHKAENLSGSNRMNRFLARHKLNKLLQEAIDIEKFLVAFFCIHDNLFEAIQCQFNQFAAEVLQVDDEDSRKAIHLSNIGCTAEVEGVGSQSSMRIG